MFVIAVVDVVFVPVLVVVGVDLWIQDFQCMDDCNHRH